MPFLNFNIVTFKHFAALSPEKQIPVMHSQPKSKAKRDGDIAVTIAQCYKGLTVSVMLMPTISSIEDGAAIYRQMLWTKLLAFQHTSAHSYSPKVGTQESIFRLWV